MAMVFSNTTDRTGIIELLEDLTGTQSVTTSSYPLKTKTRDINNAYSHFLNLADRVAGRHQVDDTNQTALPVHTISLVSGTPNYAYTVDTAGTPNQILRIQKIRFKLPSGQWSDDLEQIDKDEVDISEYQNLTGTPEKYDLIGNNIILYPTPNYNSSGGLEITVTRTPFYFLSTDTTKKPGIPDMFHEYLAIRPAYYFCVAKELFKRAEYYAVEMNRLENETKKYYSNRNNILQDRITPETSQHI